jgi:hypothetical protein
MTSHTPIKLGVFFYLVNEKFKPNINGRKTKLDGASEH